MKTSRTRRVLLAAAAASVALAACSGGNVGGGGGGGGGGDGGGGGSDYPTGPVTLTVGQAAGGSTDLIARALAAGMTDELGVAMPVVNQPGANGALATQEVAGMTSDGSTLVLLNASLITITPLAVTESETVSLDDLDVLVGLSQDDYVLVASTESGIGTLQDVIDASGTGLTFGTTGVGTGSQLAQAVLFAQAEIEGTQVPFDSGSPALTAVMGNQVQLATIQLGEAMPQIEAGTVTPIIVFSEERNTYLPDVPTALEEGYDVPVAQYRALAGPAGLPEDVRTTLIDAAEATVATDAYQQFNEDNLLTPHEIPGDQVVEEWTTLADHYASLVEEHDISLSNE